MQNFCGVSYKLYLMFLKKEHECQLNPKGLVEQWFSLWFASGQKPKWIFFVIPISRLFITKDMSRIVVIERDGGGLTYLYPAGLHY